MLGRNRVADGMEGLECGGEQVSHAERPSAGAIQLGVVAST